MDGMYRKFGLTMAINAVAMFIITYVTLWSLDHFVFSINRVYMALMMVSPMGVLMLITMRSMFKDKRLNYALHAFFIGLFLLTFAAIRTQTPIGDTAFLRSMIPHHSGAILMCRESTITDPEVAELCRQIVETQEEEIAQMQAILARGAE